MGKLALSGVSLFLKWLLGTAALLEFVSSTSIGRLDRWLCLAVSNCPGWRKSSEGSLSSQSTGRLVVPAKDLCAGTGLEFSVKLLEFLIVDDPRSTRKQLFRSRGVHDL